MEAAEQAESSTAEPAVDVAAAIAALDESSVVADDPGDAEPAASAD